MMVAAVCPWLQRYITSKAFPKALAPADVVNLCAVRDCMTVLVHGWSDVELSASSRSTVGSVAAGDWQQLFMMLIGACQRLGDVWPALLYDMPGQVFALYENLQLGSRPGVDLAAWRTASGAAADALRLAQRPAAEAEQRDQARARKQRKRAALSGGWVCSSAGPAVLAASDCALSLLAGADNALGADSGRCSKRQRSSEGVCAMCAGCWRWRRLPGDGAHLGRPVLCRHRLSRRCVASQRGPLPALP